MVRVYELFLQGDEKSIDFVARMLEAGPFVALRPEGQPVGKLVIRSDNFGEPGSDEEIKQTGDFLCATLRAAAFVQSLVELNIECFGFRIYRDHAVEKTVAYSNVVRLSTVEPNWMDDFTTPDARGMRLADKALVSAANDDRVRLVMSLCSNPATFGWREIYDVMEAIGLHQIRAKYGMSQNAIRRIMRAANAHRHLGKIAHAGPNPPTIGDAIKEVRSVVRSFLADQFERIPTPKKMEKGND